MTNFIFGNNNPVSGFKNKIINGDFRIWQRGTSFVNPDSIYTADRWLDSRGVGGSAATISRQAFLPGQTDVPGNPEFFFRHDQTGAPASGINFSQQLIEDVRTLSGNVVTLSYYAKSAAQLVMVPQETQNFGFGGSAPVVGIGVVHNITTSWKRFTYTFTLPSTSSKTIGASSFLQINWLHPAAVIYTFDVANVQLEEGSLATGFEQRPLSVELELAKRYYHFLDGANYNIGTGLFKTASDGYLGFKFKQEMREVPSVSFSGVFRVTWRVGGGTISLSTRSVDRKGIRLVGVPSSPQLAGTSFYSDNINGRISFDAEI